MSVPRFVACERFIGAGPSVLSIGCRPDQAVDEGMGPTFTVRKGGAR
jgi:hypothetical protein